MNRRIPNQRRRAVLGALALLAAAGCTGRTIVKTTPADSEVRVDGVPMRNNFFEYGRWIGNEYHITASSPGYKSKEVVTDVHLGSRAALVAFYSLVSIVGAPNVLALPWYGQLDDEIDIELEPAPRP